MKKKAVIRHQLGACHPSGGLVSCLPRQATQPIPGHHFVALRLFPGLFSVCPERAALRPTSQLYSDDWFDGLRFALAISKVTACPFGVLSARAYQHSLLPVAVGLPQRAETWTYWAANRFVTLRSPASKSHEATRAKPGVNQPTRIEENRVH